MSNYHDGGETLHASGCFACGSHEDLVASPFGWSVCRVRHCSAVWWGASRDEYFRRVSNALAYGITTESRAEIAWRDDSPATPEEQPHLDAARENVMASIEKECPHGPACCQSEPRTGPSDPEMQGLLEDLKRLAHGKLDGVTIKRQHARALLEMLYPKPPAASEPRGALIPKPHLRCPYGCEGGSSCEFCDGGTWVTVAEPLKDHDADCPLVAQGFINRDGTRKDMTDPKTEWRDEEERALINDGEPFLRFVTRERSIDSYTHLLTADDLRFLLRVGPEALGIGRSHVGADEFCERCGADIFCSCNCEPLETTGGGHRGDCPCFEPECTCYELVGGHQPGCAFHGAPVAPELVARTLARANEVAADHAIVEAAERWASSRFDEYADAALRELRAAVAAKRAALKGTK